MMKNQKMVLIVLLATAECKKTISAIKYLKYRKNYSIVVIFESELRTEYTQSQIDFKRTHLQYRLLKEKRLLLKFFTYIKFFGLKLFLRTPQRFVTPIFSIIGSIRARYYSLILRRMGVFHYIVPRISSKITSDILNTLNEPWIFLASSQWILTTDVLSDEYTIVNFHPGILPKHRSLDSFFWSILQGDGIGVSAHCIDKGIDTGPVLKRFFIIPSGNETLFNLRSKVDSLFPVFVHTIIATIETSGILTIPQELDEGVRHRPMEIDELMDTERELTRFLTLNDLSKK